MTRRISLIQPSAPMRMRSDKEGKENRRIENWIKGAEPTLNDN
jgi:hypothetical protein